jgi:hypothetical protein
MNGKNKNKTKQNKKTKQNNTKKKVVWIAFAREPSPPACAKELCFTLGGALELGDGGPPAVDVVRVVFEDARLGGTQQPRRRIDGPGFARRSGLCLALPQCVARGPHGIFSEFVPVGRFGGGRK